MMEWQSSSGVVIRRLQDADVGGVADAGAHAKDVPFAALIQVVSASGNWKAMTPAFQPLALAWSMHVPSVVGSMNPLVASAAVPGLPMTSLLRSTPFAWISKTEEPGKAPPDVVSRPVQSV